MKIDDKHINSPVLQGGGYDLTQTPSPENLKKFYNNKINFFKFSGGIRSRISIPALKDGAIDSTEQFIHEFIRLKLKLN